MLTLRPHVTPTALACAALLTAQAGCGQQAPPPELPPRSIQWDRVSATFEGERRVISGIVTAISDTKLAFEVNGTVLTVEVNLGDVVERDQVLARLDPEPIELAVRDAEAGASEARAFREVARTEYGRAVQLFEAEVISRQEFERAIAMRDSRDSQVEAASARLNLARRDLRRSVLRAPFGGAISVRNIEPAMKVAAGETAFEMDSEETGLRVEVQMPETLIARIHQGKEATVRFPSTEDPRSGEAERSYAARISEVGTRAGIGNAFPVRADLLDAPADLRPGMTAEVTFSIPAVDAELADLDGYMIPIAAALPEADDGFSVFVYDPETSTVRKTPIRVGGVLDNDLAVFEGLEEGDIIATAGVSFLFDGQQVTLLDEQLIRRSR